MRLPLRRVLLIAYVALVLVATLAPLSGDMFQGLSTLDKLAHLALFGGVSFLVLLNMNQRWHSALWALIITSLLAALIELVQGALPFRSAEWWDLWAGVIGAAIGALLAMTAHPLIQSLAAARKP